MAVRFKRVVVSAWCANPAESRNCCRLVLSDEAEIDAAIGRVPWTSPDLLKSAAGRFKKCIDDCGGKTTVVDS